MLKRHEKRYILDRPLPRRRGRGTFRRMHRRALTIKHRANTEVSSAIREYIGKSDVWAIRKPAHMKKKAMTSSGGFVYRVEGIFHI